jgi:hypothetical protein
MAANVPQLADGVTTRAPAVALLCVNSDDQEQYNRVNGLRFSTSNPSRIFINNQQPFLVGYMTRLALTEVSMEYDTPNVNDYNNTLTVGYYDISGVLQGVVRLTVPVGFYDAIELGRAVSNELNANATLDTFFGVDAFNVEFGDIDCTNPDPAQAGLTVFASKPAYSIDCLSATTVGARFAILPCTVGYPGLSPLQEDLTTMMGIVPTAGTPASYRTLLGGYASLQYTPFIDIISNLLTKNQDIRDSTTQKANINSSILARIYLANEDFKPRIVSVTYDASGEILLSDDNAIGITAGTLRREFVYPKQIQWNNTENVDVIDIQVLDSKGRPLFYNPSGTSVGGNTAVISNTADLFFTIQATES